MQALKGYKVFREYKGSKVYKVKQESQGIGMT
jgi:hypothetical protein